jgi:glycosyltransferase involved in cell wall biosynthesis
MEPVIARQNPNIYVSLYPSIGKWLQKRFPNLSLAFISSGVDLKKFTPIGDKALIDLPRPLFLTVSALVPEKQVDLTIKAFAKLNKGGLLIIGDGPLRPALVSLANSMLDKSKYLFLSLPHNDLPKYYRSADVFAFSAPKEIGWSIVHLEALASNLPVVANREENLEFLLGKDWPFFCDVRSVDDYSKTLEKALRVKVDSRQLVKNYSWEKIAGKHKELIFSILNEKNKKI